MQKSITSKVLHFVLSMVSSGRTRPSRAERWEQEAAQKCSAFSVRSFQ